MRNNPEMAEYKIKGIDNSTEKSETFKHKLSIFEEKSQKIASVIMLVTIIQFIIILLSSMGLVSNMFKSFLLMAVSIFVISTVIIKYRKLKKIYRREFDKVKINVKPAQLDKIQLGLSVVMFITGVASLVFI